MSPESSVGRQRRLLRVALQITLALAGSAALSGCGQKGPLTLPASAAAASAASAAASAPR
ncbi:MAG: lipoprotein [Rubrivivax sp.]|nr:lipoprotein [Rubrivivax sp.]